jgi:predicted ATPase/class 3 adenylate cyclase
MRRLPSGTVTLLFTDIEGSTRLAQQLGQEGFNEALAEHRQVLREAFRDNRGVGLRTEGDSFFAAFASARDAVAAAAQAQRQLENGPLEVRIGIHTGEPLPVTHEDGYVGVEVHRAARIMSAGHGGQVLLSQSTRNLLHEDIELRDLGEHRLKDLTDPQRLYQLIIEGLPEDFPPLKTLDASLTNLPTQATPLTGRRRELDELQKLLTDARLVTLTGAGGTGKTRLALQLAAEFGDRFSSGAVVVFLAPVTEPSAVMPAIAKTLRLREGSSQTLSEALTAYLQTRELLVVLDNCEHVLPAASDVAGLLAAAPNLKIVATSRAPLRVAGEREYAVEPLPSSDAEQLYVERALAVDAAFDAHGHFESIREICARLDGLPLAIELAAARGRSMTPESLLQRLDSALELLTTGSRDAEVRHQTLRATIAWSYRLLDQQDQVVFRRLGVFRGGWTLEAAAKVCCEGGEREPFVLDVLDRLVEHSLVRAGRGVLGTERYFMLETIREFAREQSEAEGDLSAACRCHADYVTAQCEHGAADFVGQASGEWLERLDAEISNVSAALAWLLAAGDFEGMAKLVAAMWPWWDIRGQWSDGRRWIEAVRAQPPDSRELRARILYGAAALAELQGDHEAAKRAAAEAVTMFRDSSNPVELGRALGRLGRIYISGNELVEGVALLEESAALARASGDLGALAVALNNLANGALKAREFERARSLAQESLELSRAVNEEHGVMVALYNTGWSYFEEGELEEAETLFAEVIELAQQRGWREGVLFPLEALATVASRRGEAEGAAELLGAAAAMREQLGQDDSRVAEETLAVRAALGESQFLQAFNDGSRMPLQAAIARALESADHAAGPGAS